MRFRIAITFFRFIPKARDVQLTGKWRKRKQIERDVDGELKKE